MKKFVQILSPLCIMCCWLISCSGESQVGEQAPRIVGFVNFVRQNDYRENDSEKMLFEATFNEVELARNYDLPTTFLLQYDALIDPRYQELMKSLPNGCEVGGWWEITKPHYEAAGQVWPFEQPWYPYDVLDFGIGHNPQVRMKLVDAYMEKFREVFGYYPKSMGSWYIDSFTLGYMKEKYDIKASCVCKEQVGTDGYTLWGSYWNQAFYPSRVNAHMPAQTEQGAIKVPVFRMLGSDPVYQYDDALGDNGQGVCTMEPVYALGGGLRSWVESYMNTFVNEKCLDFNYVQLGQENSFTWPRIGKALQMQCHIIDSLRNEGLVQVKTLSSCGEWFLDRYEHTPATAVTVMEDTRHQGKKTVWFNSRFFRTSLIWEKEGFRIRDMHIFNENKKSGYHDSAATGTQLVYNTLPVMDGFLWSEGNDKAGFKIRLSGATDSGTGGDPAICEEAGKMTISFPVSEHCEFTFTLTENEFCICGPCGVSWALDCYVPKYDLVPVTGIDCEAATFRFEDFDYCLTLKEGRFEKGSLTHPFAIIPDNGEIRISFK